MNSTGISPSRVTVGFLALAAIAGLLALDAAQSEPVDLFGAPPAVALGSGETPTGAHCTGM